MEKELFLAALHSIGITHTKLHDIFCDNQDYKLFFETLNASVLVEFGCTTKQAETIMEYKKYVNFSKLATTIEKRGVSLMTIHDEMYPEALKKIPRPPYVLYVRGKIDTAPKMAVVGSRKITSYGEKVIQDIVGELGKYFVIVSGGAGGCDTKAHKVALLTPKKTIAVIGTGIDLDYPVQNTALYDEIVREGGAVISIFPIGEVGNAYNFPIRNEIVAGLAVGTLVIEAHEKSGSLITAHLALDMGKDVFAIPGDITRPSSVGCNQMIKNAGAKLVITVADILEEYNIHNHISERKNYNFTNPLEESIYHHLILEQYTIDELAKKMQLDIGVIGAKLSMMEIKKMICKGLGGKYCVN